MFYFDRLLAFCLVGFFFAIRGFSRWFGKGLLVAVLLVFLLLGSFDEFVISPVDLLVLPYEYSVLDWELSNLSDKWVRKTVGLFSGQSDLEDNELIDQTQEFFVLGLELRRLERDLVLAGSLSVDGDGSTDKVEQLVDQIDSLEVERSGLQAVSEEVIESEIESVLDKEGLSYSIGIFPPVDVVFSRSPHVLIFSPRDRIERSRDILLSPGLDVSEKEFIEDRIVGLEDWSVYIEDTGGVAVYPSVVSDVFGLHNAVEIATHEWLHHWLFFRPLGRSFWSGGDEASLNETVATIAGRELGDLAFESLTGETVSRDSTPSDSVADPDQFSFRDEMRETRLRAEELLLEGKIDEAESYMESRRQLFVENGFLIRKLNQAYFAFHGTYATSAASVSPIGDQVQELRDRSGSVKEFLNTVSGFGSYQEFVDHLEVLRLEEGG